ncbi:MAG: Kae1-associated kinase Bud32 [Candidatus Odinarchaeia archaeon]
MLIAKGAEAYLYKEEWYGKTVIRKFRVAKAYRVPELDLKLRAYRTVHEAKMYNEARKAGVPTPIVYSVDIENTTLIYEYIDGKRIKDIIDNLPKDEMKEICIKIGRTIGDLHKSDIIHGDLTTSNMLLTNDGRIVFIDFGLSERTYEVEDKGVDLHLMRRALQSTHYRNAEKCFKWIIEGYASIVGEAAKVILKRVREIEKRGRYIAERKTLV